MTTVGSISTNNVSNTIDFSKATNIHLTALTRYGSELTLKADEGSTILIDNLASVDINGLESTLDLTIEGASSLNFSKITDGDISATDVGEVTGGADHDGTITLSGVTKAVIPHFTRGLTISDTNDLEYLHVIGDTPNVATGATAVTTTPNFDVTGQTAIKTLIIDGTLGNVTLSGNTDLETLTFTASAEALKIDGASNLASADLAGKAKSITVTDNGDLETLTITTELNTAKGNATTASTAGSLNVSTNGDLTKLTTAYDPVNSVTVSTNAKLAMIDFTGTELVGATTDVATVDISDNDLTASVVDQYAAAETGVGSGTISDESMISTWKKYLTAAVAAPSSTGVQVKIDEVDLTQNQAAGADAIESEVTDWAMINVTKTVTTAGVTTVAGQKAISYQGGDKIGLQHVSGGITTSIIPDNTALNSNPSLAVSEILSDANAYVAAASAVGVTLSASVAGGSEVSLAILANNSSATNEAANAGSGAGSATDIIATDAIGLTIGGVTATDVAGVLADNVAIATKLASIWNTKYNANSTYTAFTVEDDLAGGLTIKSDESAGSRTDGTTVSVVVQQSATDTTTIPVLGYKIGKFKAGGDDNKTTSSNIIVTLTSNNGGTEYDGIQSAAVATTTNDAGLALTSGTTTATSVQRTLALSDAIAAVDGTADTVASGSAVSYLSWID
jgi:hypothetical protein